MPNFEFLGFFNAFDGFVWLTAIRDWIEQFFVWLQTKYIEAPALILGVGVALAVPTIATAGALIRLMARGKSPPETTDDHTVRTRPISVWRQNASLVMPDNSQYPIGQGILRIGREADNDLRLSDPSVHRYHAVLERSPEAEYIISYVGDPDHDGLLINGLAAHRQRLRGGEVLEIGAIKLRFSVSPA